ncbi:lysM and putative peptidoglycan-binding domain-containing protein 3 [Parasteatoda tepidariorum]|uniref:lysM and putative peptidoglycan-binding domain-containing protein 3 n=1 Tax=Parasteatoda tepidariorum TaxID=114398 RepID=UPI00077FE15F|nr:lysM and putative peptidoglycan-binding domain-containing protein 3-like [Parasteatoda tepidariorum]
MNDVLVLNMTSNSKRRQNPSNKYDKRFTSSKRKSKNAMFEKKPLLDLDSSDEEVTLHDIRHFKKPSKHFVEASSLRKLKKPSNGNFVENTNSLDPFQNCEFLDLTIENSETLQSISVKYQCPIADIKRANNLMSDQDFYALKHLKIPVKKYSLLTELLPVASETKAEPSTIVEEGDTRTINIGIGSAGRCPSPQDTAAFFKRMDEDLVKIMLSTNSQKDSLEAATVILTAPQIQPLVKDPYDCGIQWNYLIVFIIVIAVIIPTLIALYMYMRSPHDYSSNAPNEDFHSDSKLGIETGS